MKSLKNTANTPLVEFVIPQEVQWQIARENVHAARLVADLNNGHAILNVNPMSLLLFTM
jgi:hypothetical protein